MYPWLKFSAIVGATYFAPINSMALSSHQIRLHDSIGHQIRAPINCSRELDEDVPGTLTGIASSGDAKIVYTTAGGVFTYAVCNILGYHDVINKDHPCAQYGIAVGAVVGTVAFTVSKLQETTGTTTSQRRDDNKESITLAELMQEHYETSPYMTFNKIEVETLPTISRTLSNNATGTLDNHYLTDTIHILGVRHPDLNVTFDHVLKSYADGTGFLRMSPTVSNSTYTTPLSKRHDGPGFKYNWRRFSYDGNHLGDPDLSWLPQYGAAVGNDWASRADELEMSEYFVVGGVKDLTTFGLRIIPEIDGFGEDYEDVNACGDLSPEAQRVHDELR